MLNSLQQLTTSLKRVVQKTAEVRSSKTFPKKNLETNEDILTSAELRQKVIDDLRIK